MYREFILKRTTKPVLNMKQTSDTILSIIIPTYNCESYISECLNSVLDDNQDNVEIIVVDDGSTDGTKSILSSYENVYGNLKILYRPHKGSSGARNTGLDNATGEFVAFLDCDDTMRAGFIREGINLISKGADLYIFGIERLYLSGEKELWNIADHVYADVSDYADEYIRVRKLLIYSNCNKFYRRKIIEDNHLRFDESLSYGEDRLFNFNYLPFAGSVITSSLIMLSYRQRREDSLSYVHVPEFFKNVVDLHRAKINCFCNLSKGTTQDEQIDFIAYDLSREVERAIDRFEYHPEEEAENLPYINRLVFGSVPDLKKPIDILLVLGSNNCEYRIERALEIGKQHPGIIYIVSGGNPHISEMGTEAEFMADYLKKNGVPVTDYIIENRAQNSFQNLTFSSSIVDSIEHERPEGSEKLRIGIITGGFHIPRTRMVLESVNGFPNADVVFIPAYGPNTAPDNWYKNPTGRAIVLSEIRKLAILKKFRDYKKGPFRE